MKCTIITVSYNAADTIESTINSVLSQDYNNIEYIIIDGNSSDGTLDIIKKYDSKITKWISEKDQGIYDAMNKGIQIATGNVIGILNADDLYANSSVISSVINKFNHTNSDAVYGDLKYVLKNDISKTIRFWKSGEYKEGKFLKGWMPPHPTFFVKKDLYDRYGLYRTDMPSAADYELMLRLVHKNKINIAYLPELITIMREGGVSNNSLTNRWKANRDDLRAWRVNGLKPNMFTLILKPLSKVIQFVVKN
jgi:glycosyltransferase involved in cell wall biosynthesis